MYQRCKLLKIPAFNNQGPYPETPVTQCDTFRMWTIVPFNQIQ